MVVLGGFAPEDQDELNIVFDDDAEERAWVTFATGRRTSSGGNYDIQSIARFADQMLVEMRKRRKKFPEDGPYR